MTQLDAPTTTIAARSLRLHPSVALRPEPFGALAYHYDTRRLVFLKHPTLVDLVRRLEHHDSVADAMTAADIPADRRDDYESAIRSLLDSEMLDDQAG